jgi:flagellar assembly factor FliW
MKIDTARFGPLDVNSDEVVLFAEGLLGLEDCRRWIFLPDAESDSVAWMQCVDRPEIALAVVSPRRFVPDYRARVARRELEPLELEATDDAHVLVVVGKAGRTVTLNLKAPVVINLERCLGRQVVTNGSMPVHFELSNEAAAIKKIA